MREKREGDLLINMQIDAALTLCELASTKDDNAQELLVRAGTGDLLATCLRHPSSEVKRSAILAIEQWMYSDDRMTLYAIEFVLALIQNGMIPLNPSHPFPPLSLSPSPCTFSLSHNQGVQVSPRVKELMTGLKSVSKLKPDLTPIASLIADIKQRPESNIQIMNKI